MIAWWESTSEAFLAVVPQLRAVAYYRHSAQDRQENSIAIQREQVREWASKNGVEIIHEFADAGKSGLTSEGRPAFLEMMEEWVKKRSDFTYVLCLDVSRWGRFQDIDLSAQFSAECRKNGKTVIYTSIGKPREDDPLYPVYVQFERFRAAQYSRELSDKVWRGCVKISEQGYWAGGSPPYGLKRLLLDERREPLHPLEPGQRKGIQNQRVTLVAGDPDEVATIRRIFQEFVELRHSEYRIAEGLNTDAIPAPGGRRWGAGSVVDRLQQEVYIGTQVYNRTSQKLKTPRRPNPPEAWVRTPDAFVGIISHEQFERAQEILRERRTRFDPAHMLAQLDTLYRDHGVFRTSLLRLSDELPTVGTFTRHFGSWDEAFQRLYPATRESARDQVQSQISALGADVLTYADFLVLNEKLTISIQPAVPIPWGYSAYWPLSVDRRPVIDLTLGVLLADPPDAEILGYVVFPRGQLTHRRLRISLTTPLTDLFGHPDLSFLHQLL